MSLRVWLPMNGNTNNYGLSTVTLSSGTPTYSDGKIGLCMSDGTLIFNVGDSLINTMSNTNTYSMCAWVKRTSTSTTAWVFYMGTGTTSMARGMWEIDTATTGTYIHWAYSGSGTNISTKASYTKTEWNHVCFVVNGSSTSLYLNGVLQSTATGCKTTELTTNQVVLNSALYSINDFRIYDHCLSVREISEISKGLCLHYKLDKIGGVTSPNIMNQSQAGIGRNAKTLDTDGTYIGQTNGTGSWSELYPYTYPVNTLAVADLVGKTYTISALVKWNSVSATILGASYMGYGGFTTSGGRTYDINVAMTSYKIVGTNKAVSASTITANTWYRVYYTFTIPTTWTTASVYLRLQIKTASGVASGTNFYYKQIKMEEGSTPTEWCPNASDAMYTSLGYDLSQVDDCSGMGNNGTPANITISTDSKIYDKCAVFNGSTAYINAGKGGKVTDLISVAFWGYMDDWTSGNYSIASCTESGGWNFEHTTDGNTYLVFIAYVSSAYKYSKSAGTLSAGWHHFVGVWDGYKSNLYVDGVSKGNNTEALTVKTAITYNTANSIMVGAEAAGGSNPAGNYFNGKLSDFRIYGTALTQEDVTKLYKVREEIDKNGILYTNEIIENGALSKFNANGTVNTNIFKECPIYFDYTKYTESDGSVWLRIVRQNNPKGNMFSSSDSFTTLVHKSDDMWFNAAFCNYVSQSGKWELMIKQKADNTTSTSEQKFRWTQTTNPMAGDYSSTARSSGNITFTSLSGYTTTAYGGIYKINSKTYICMNNGTNGNWCGAIGPWTTTWNSGALPGVNELVITTGYLDLYIRIDQLSSYTGTLSKASISKDSTVSSYNIQEN